jgi:CBS domain-containing protein
MRHPKRAIRRDVRTRNPKRRGRSAAELEATAWPEGAVRVKDLMTRAPVTARTDTGVGAAWRLMRERKVRHLPVLDARGALVGIVSDRDLRTIAAPGPEPGAAAARPRTDVPLGRVMTWGVVTAQPETELRHAARIMQDQRIGTLAVVDRGRLVGMLSAVDLLGGLVRILDEGIVSRPGRWGAED